MAKLIKLFVVLSVFSGALGCGSKPNAEEVNKETQKQSAEQAKSPENQ